MGTYLALRRREPGAIGVRGVSAQEQQSLAPELGEARDIRRGAVDRSLVEFVVPGHEHCSELRAERDRATVRDRMRHMDQLHRERSCGELLAGREVLERGVPEVVLVEL